MALKGGKYAIEIQKYDAIKHNQIFFDFMLRIFNHLNQLYEKEKSVMIHTILKYQSRKKCDKSNSNEKQVHAEKKSVVKRKMLECVKIGDKVVFKKQTKNKMEKVLKRKRLNYLSVV